jgi:hypothetical protein
MPRYRLCVGTVRPSETRGSVKVRLCELSLAATKQGLGGATAHQALVTQSVEYMGVGTRRRWSAVSRHRGCRVASQGSRVCISLEGISSCVWTGCLSVQPGLLHHYGTIEVPTSQGATCITILKCFRVGWTSTRNWNHLKARQRNAVLDTSLATLQ